MPSSFIRRSSRIAIYLRDNWTCVYCQWEAPVAHRAHILQGLGHSQGVENGGLSLDHVVSRAARSRSQRKHGPESLVTACHLCNSTKKADSIEVLCLRRGISEPDAVRGVYLAVRRRTARHRRLVSGWLRLMELAPSEVRGALALRLVAGVTDAEWPVGDWTPEDF